MSGLFMILRRSLMLYAFSFSFSRSFFREQPIYDNPKYYTDKVTERNYSTQKALIS